MIIRADERNVSWKENLRGGDGAVGMGGFEPPVMPNHARLFSKIELNPGCSIGSHQHDGEYEIFYYLEGEITLNDNGTEKLMHPGDFSLCYDGETHGIANRTDKPASLFAAIITKAE